MSTCRATCPLPKPNDLEGSERGGVSILLETAKDIAAQVSALLTGSSAESVGEFLFGKVS